MGAANARVNALRAQPPANLSDEDVGEIINQNDRLRTMVTETNGEMVKYRNRSLAQFLPVEIYNDEKRQYIIEQLTNINCPFVEEDTTIYVPDYYEKSVLKAAAAFKPMNNQTVRDRLKFYIDRLIYSANSFDELLFLLEKQGYAIKRNKYTAIKPPYAKRFMRLRSLGEDYTEVALKKRIEERNEIPNEFKRMQEQYASELQQPFYYAINTNISLVRNFRITPTKQDTQYPYSFTNDCTIERLTSCLGTLSEFNINSRSELYKASERLQEQIENCTDEGERVDLKIQYAKISATIRIYEEIVVGNYIDNLLKAERERTKAEQKKENTPEQPIKQTINRKIHRR